MPKVRAPAVVSIVKPEALVPRKVVPVNAKVETVALPETVKAEVVT